MTRLTLLLWLVAGVAVAQPKGPRDVITGAKAEQRAREMQRAAEKGEAQTPVPPKPEAADQAPAGQAPAEEPAGQAPAGQPPAGQQLPPGHPPTGGAPAPGGAAASPHAAGAPTSQPAEQRPLTEARVDTLLPVGTIKVRVLDHLEQPVAGQEVRIGIMSGDGSREEKKLISAADGYATFSGLEAGTNKAYRASIEHDGAKYAANPFRLPPRGGHHITIRRLPVTRDDRMLVLYVGAASVELKDDRIKVVQQARLLNIGRETYVFPDEGTLVTLPKGFIAFQTQESMTDQRMTEESGKGARVKGSVPPGETTLMWGFDMPMEGTDATFAVDIPWRTFAYRVVSDAPDGLSLKVADMPEAQLHTDQGRRFLVTSVQRKVGEEPFRRLEITLTGIPGPGPARWIAALLSLFAVIGGFVLARRPPERAASVEASADHAARKKALLARGKALEAERESNAIGPEYFAEQRKQLEEELAELLFVEAKLAKKKA